MSTGYASICGGIAGLLLGASIAFVQDIQTAATLYRLLVLSIGGAWMGYILSCLDNTLSEYSNEHVDDRRDRLS